MQLICHQKHPTPAYYFILKRFYSLFSAFVPCYQKILQWVVKVSSARPVSKIFLSDYSKGMQRERPDWKPITLLLNTSPSVMYSLHSDF